MQPNTGENFVLELPATDHDCLQVFLDQFASPTRRKRARCRCSSWTTAVRTVPRRCAGPRVVPLFLPSYCPELNPIERWWQELKTALSNTLYGTLEALRARLDAELATWNHGAERMASLTGYPYLIDALAMMDQP